MQTVVLPSGPLRHPQEHNNASPTACNEVNTNHAHTCTGDYQGQALMQEAVMQHLNTCVTFGSN